MSTNQTITSNLQQLQCELAEKIKYYHLKPLSVCLLAVCKGQSVAAIEAAFHAGQRDFAENYLQEAANKMMLLCDLPICWHFIGSIQRNKAKQIAKHFSWVHSLDRAEIAFLLNKYRPQDLPPLNICLQINLDNEASKSGLNQEELLEFIYLLKPLSRLKLRGLMCIPKSQPTENQQYLSFLRLKNLQDKLNNLANISIDTLSMGMSDDWLPAIHAGSTIIRLGRAIFGERIRSIQ